VNDTLMALEEQSSFHINFLNIRIRSYEDLDMIEKQISGDLRIKILLCTTLVVLPILQLFMYTKNPVEGWTRRDHMSFRVKIW